MLKITKISAISIVIRKNCDGLWVMISDDLPEFYLAGKDLEMLERDIPRVIKLLLEKNYGVSVSEVIKPTKPVYMRQPSLAPAFESPETWAANLVPA